MLGPLIILINLETPSYLVACKPNKRSKGKTMCHCCVMLLILAIMYEVKDIYVN